MRVWYLFILVVLFAGGSLGYQELFPSLPKKKIYSDTIIIATGMPIGEIRPFFRYGVGAMFSHLVYTPLLDYDESVVDFKPLAAEKFELVDEGKKIRIVLKSINAEDLQRSFDYFKEYNPLEASEVLKNLIRIEKVSYNEVIIHLKRYDRLFLEYLKALPMVAFTQEDWTTGDFRLKESTKDFFVLERKNKLKESANYIKVIQIKNFKEAFEALDTAKVDFLLYSNRVDLEGIEDQSKFKVVYHSSPYFFEILENKKKDFANKFDWNKLKSQLDEKNLKNIIGDSFVGLMESPIPKNSYWYLPLKNEKKIDINLEKNISEFKSISLHFHPTTGREQQIVRLVKTLIENNYDMDIKLIEENFDNFSNADILSSKENGLFGNYDLYLVFSGISSPFSKNYFYYYSDTDSALWNLGHYKNDQVNYYLDQARYNPNFEQARAPFNYAMQEVMEDPPGLFLAWMKMPLIYRKNCESLELDSYTFFRTFKYARCEQ